MEIHSKELLGIIKDKREEISGQSPIKASILPASIWSKAESPGLTFSPLFFIEGLFAIVPVSRKEMSHGHDSAHQMETERLQRKQAGW